MLATVDTDTGAMGIVESELECMCMETVSAVVDATAASLVIIIHCVHTVRVHNHHG